jgi:hypothetical protein
MSQLCDLQKCVIITRLRDKGHRRKQGTGRKKVSQGNDDALSVNFLRESTLLRKQYILSMSRRLQKMIDADGAQIKY